MRDRWWLFQWPAVLVVALASAACSPPAPVVEEWDPDGEITTPMREIPRQIDPQRTGNPEQMRHNQMIFEALMTLDPVTLRAVPAAAKDDPTVSADGLTYTFTLRDGLTYSDGAPVTAKDFAYAFARACDPAHRGTASVSFRVVVGCERLSRIDLVKASETDLLSARAALGLRAVGDNTLIVTLTEPASYFTTLATFPPAYPVRESDVTKAGPSYGSDVGTLIGNGPFKLVEWTPDQRLVFERNDRYRSPAKLRRWTKVVVGDDLAFAAYRNNEIDFYGGLPSGRAGSVGANAEAIEADPVLRTEVVRVPGAFTDIWVLNVSRPPFTDRKVRQAVAKAVDRPAVIPKSFEPAGSLIPPGRPGHDPGDTFQWFDPVQARELLRSSGFAGALPDVRITYPIADPFGPTLAELLQQQLKRNLDIEVATHPADELTLRDMYRTPQTAPQIRFLRLRGVPDPQGLTSWFDSSSPVASGVGYRNADYDALVREADRERDPQRRLGLYQRAVRILSEDAVAVWQGWGPNEYLRKSRVRGVTSTGGEAEYGILNVTEIYVTKRK